MKRTNLVFNETDLDCIRIIQQRYGLTNATNAIRMALRVLANAGPLALAPLSSEPCPPYAATPIANKAEIERGAT